VGKIRVTIVCMEKDTQVMIIAIALIIIMIIIIIIIQINNTIINKSINK
jgi:hypothetical protein